jgi:hypothetical protein
MTQQSDYDVVVIGGGAAGLGAAVTLGRSRRTVAVVDAGQPRNAPAAGVHGYLTRDGLPPAELVRIGRLEAQGYGAELLDGHVEQVQRADDRQARRPAAADAGSPVGGCWSRPGWSTSSPTSGPAGAVGPGRPALPVLPRLGGPRPADRVLASGPDVGPPALLFRQLTDDVTILSHARPPTPSRRSSSWPAASGSWTRRSPRSRWRTTS